MLPWNSNLGLRFEERLRISKTRNVCNKLTPLIDLIRSQFLKNILLTVFNFILIAFELGKNYDQDNELKWGVASKEKKVSLKKRPKLKSTQKK